VLIIFEKVAFLLVFGVLEALLDSISVAYPGIWARFVLEITDFRLAGVVLSVFIDEECIFTTRFNR